MSEEWRLSCTPFGLIQYPDGSKAVMAWNEAEAKRLVEWHNAALAAERKKFSLTSLTGAQLTWGEVLQEENKQLREQLAAEREKLEAVIDEEITKNNELREQLATDREKAWTQAAVIRELEAELAAEREKVQTLVDALKAINDLLDEYSDSEKPAVDTLSKIEAISYTALEKQKG